MEERPTAETAAKALPETTATTSFEVQGAVGGSDADDEEEVKEDPTSEAANRPSRVLASPAADAERTDIPATTSATETSAPAAASAATAAAAADVEDHVPAHSELRYAVESYNAIYKPGACVDSSQCCKEKRGTVGAGRYLLIVSCCAVWTSPDAMGLGLAWPTHEY